MVNHPNPGGSAARRGGDRGGFAVVSLSLILLLTLAMTGLIVTVSMGILSQADGEARITDMEQRMVAMDSQASLVALGGSPSRRFDFGMSGDPGDLRVDADAGWMRVNSSSGADAETIVNTTLGAVVYEREDEAVAYQAGGVWRRQRQGSVMVSPPDPYYQDKTLTLPIIRIDDGDGPKKPMSITPNGTIKYYPNETLGYENPLNDGQVELTVKSDYYRAWGAYFESRTAGDVVDIDDGNETVTVVLSVPTEKLSFDSSLTSTGGMQLKLETEGEADTYNSSEGPYPESQGGPAPIRTSGDVKIEDTVTAHVYTQGDIEVEGTLDGNACAEGEIENSGTVTGWENDTTCSVEITDYPLADDEITDQLSTAETTNDNDGTDCIDGSTIVADCTGDDALSAGTYYLTEGAINDREVDFDTADGPVDLVVDDSLEVSGSSHLDIATLAPTDGVTVYVDGAFKLSGNATVETDANQSAALLTLKVRSGRGVRLQSAGGDTSLVGVVYAPGSGCGSEVVKVENGADLYGALVVDCPDKIETAGGLHYDTSLNDQDDVITVENPLTHLHVSVNRVAISDG